LIARTQVSSLPMFQDETGEDWPLKFDSQISPLLKTKVPAVTTDSPPTIYPYTEYLA
jgi:hypothetical protein